MYKSNVLISEIWIFIKRHIIICILCLICIWIILVFCNIPVPKHFPCFLKRFFLYPNEETTEYEILSLLDNLSLAYIASIITFFAIQYIPERKRAKKAFSILKKELTSLYSYIGYLIGMYLYEIDVKCPEKRIKIDLLTKIQKIEISNKLIQCKINGIPSSNNLYGDSKKYVDLINEKLDEIKGTPCFSQIDETLAETISIIDNNDFIGFISGINEPFESFPGYQNIIYDFDEKFYELIKCHRILSKYNFKQITNIFSPITEEEIKTEKERRVFQISRLHYEEHGCQEAENVANMIISLEPNEERVEKSIGVMLEMIVYYDMKTQKESILLYSALKIAEYIQKYHKSDKNNNILNTIQIKRDLTMYQIKTSYYYKK